MRSEGGDSFSHLEAVVTIRNEKKISITLFLCVLHLLVY